MPKYRDSAEQVVSDAIDNAAAAADAPNVRSDQITKLAADYHGLDISDKIKLWKFIEKDIEHHREEIAKQLATIDKLLGVTTATRQKPTTTGAGPVKAKRTVATTFKPGPAHQAIVDWIKKHGKAVKKEDVISNKKEVFKGLDAPGDNTIKQYMGNLKANGFLAGGHGEFESK